jgi:hypothetical protein
MKLVFGILGILASMIFGYELYARWASLDGMATLAFFGASAWSLSQGLDEIGGWLERA